MNSNDYSKGNGKYNNDPYSGMNNNYYNKNGYLGNDFENNYYGSNDDNYTVPLQGKDLPKQNGYSEKSVWGDFDQGRFDGKNTSYDSYNYKNDSYGNMGYDNDYMNNEYNYYDDNYLYEDQYSIDYSNSSSNYGNNVYDYSGYNGSVYDDQYSSSLYNISNKLNENVQDEMLYTSLMNQSNDKRGNFGNNADPYDNRTVALDMNNMNINNNRNSNSNGGYNTSSYNVNDSSVYGEIDSNSHYFHRNGAYDNKLIPTEDIVFDDAYVVRNQLFEDEEKLFSLNDILSFFICIVFAVILAFLITRYVAQLTEVDGTSMTHNLQDKDDLLLDKFTYKIRNPKRFEIIVFPVPGEGYYIKRIIGLPGEKVDVYGAKFDNSGNLVEKSKILINDKELTEDVYGYQDIIGTEGDNSHVTLGKDEYYVMGDNRNGSNDSRNSKVGVQKREDFVGRAIFRVFPSPGFIDSHINDKIYNGDTVLKNKYNVE